MTIIEKVFAFLNKLPPDKAQHMAYACILFASMHLMFGTKPAVIAVLVSAIGKEVYDYFHKDKHTSDPWDALATSSGIVIGYVCTVPPIFQ